MARHKSELVRYGEGQDLVELVQVCLDVWENDPDQVV